ncbi:hypothetical protein JOB18_040619 [Solea senegalensis]|uniref:Uncharacterized protein n=1 Tax=Solea senegalensis TaxID=28829 RepID=A0AAV6QPJ6_SOLSE|nr:hypothetical protein JOB18_040619 [Solea senegalensis]
MVVADPTGFLTRNRKPGRQLGLRPGELVVHKGHLSQRSVTDAVAVGCKIVGHFKHSALANSHLEDIQLEILPANRLQQDVQNCWNYMIQSLIEQKGALGIFVSEYGLPDTLTAHQWKLLEKVLSVLGLFEELTRKVSSSDAIPAVTVLHSFLTRETDWDQSNEGNLACSCQEEIH